MLLLSNANAGGLYFDHQAATPVDPAVFEVMRPYFTNLYGNAHSAEHLFGRMAHEAVEKARSQIARCIDCEPEDLVFTSGATEANNLAILGAARAGVSQRDTILVSSIEHASVLAAANATDCRVVSIPVDANGVVDLAALQAVLSPRVLLVSVGYANNEIGTVQDIRSIGELVQAEGGLFHVDAAQALTALAIQASSLPVDFMSLSAHKAYGPKGVGALYVAPGRRRSLRPLFYGGGQEGGLRAGTLPTPLCVGFGKACELLLHDGAVERQNVRRRRMLLLDRLRHVESGIEVIGPLDERRHPGNLSVRFPVCDARDLLERVSSELACSTGSACHSGTEAASHVLAAIGLAGEKARQVIRFGIGRFTSDVDCLKAAEILGNAAREIRYPDE